MNVEALRIALAVADSGSFAATARNLGVDPSSISRTIAAVEAEMGIRLFQRSTRRLAPTEEGGAYLARIAPLLDELERAKQAALSRRSGPAGTLRMTASVAYGSERIVPNLDAYRTAFPEIRLELLLTDSNLDLVADNLDLAIRLTPAPRGDLISTRLADTRYRVCAAPPWIERFGRPEHPAALGEADCLRLAMPEHRERWRFRAAGSAEGAGFDVTVAGSIVISSPLGLRSAARHGLGPALLADWLVAGDLAAGTLVDLFPSYEATATTFDTGAWALYPSRAYLPAKVRVTIDFLRSKLGRA